MSRPERFAELLRRVARGAARMERSEVCCGDFTLQQFDTLRAVRDLPAATTGALAARLGIDLSTASRNLSLLERDGHVRRTRDGADGRRVVHALTAKGARSLGSLHCEQRDVLASVLRRVPPAERDAVLDALATLVRALEPAGEGEASARDAAPARAAAHADAE